MNDGTKFPYVMERGWDAPDFEEAIGTQREASTRLKLRYVLAVWGEKYIDRYFESAFPTHLSPNNLPALARDHDLSFVVLTRAEDRETFKRHTRFARLQRLGRVEFITIDDLISHPGVFTVTLTLAFTRAMRAAGAEATGINFIFMNADFILADGTLATVARRLQSGKRAVMAASPRTIAEDLGPRVAALPRSSDGAITIAPRDAVAMALAAPHAMVFAKQPNLQLVHTIVPNQYFWFVDNNTLLARSFLMFMLAVRPSRPAYRATSYCDYSLVADLVDDEDISVIDDSDDGFILELQSRNQEMDTVRFGPLTETAAAEHLAEWTTAHHRSLARHDLLFHSGQLPPQLDPTRLEAAAYIDRLLAALPAPVDAHRHPYWLGGVRAWHYHRPDDPLPVEVEPFGKTSPAELTAEAAAAAKAAAGSSSVAEPAHAPPQKPPRAGLIYRSIYQAALPLRGALLAEPVRGDVMPAVAEVLRARGSRGPVWLVGEPIGQVWRQVGTGPFRALPLDALDTAAEKRIPEGTRVVICLTDNSLARLPAAFKLAHRAATGGGKAAIIVARQSRPAAEFNPALIEALMACEPISVRHSRSMVRESDYFATRRNRFREALGELRQEPSPRRLARAGLSLAHLAAAQVRLRWPGLRISTKVETRLDGVVFLVNHARNRDRVQ